MHVATCSGAWVRVAGLASVYFINGNRERNCKLKLGDLRKNESCRIWPDDHPGTGFYRDRASRTERVRMGTEAAYGGIGLSRPFSAFLDLSRVTIARTGVGPHCCPAVAPMLPRCCPFQSGTGKLTCQAAQGIGGKRFLTAYGAVAAVWV